MSRNTMKLDLSAWRECDLEHLDPNQPVWVNGGHLPGGHRIAPSTGPSGHEAPVVAKRSVAITRIGPGHERYPENNDNTSAAPVVHVHREDRGCTTRTAMLWFSLANEKKLGQKEWCSSPPPTWLNARRHVTSSSPSATALHCGTVDELSGILQANRQALCATISMHVIPSRYYE
jgi:hypothetical protein